MPHTDPHLTNDIHLVALLHPDTTLCDIIVADHPETVTTSYVSRVTCPTCLIHL